MSLLVVAVLTVVLLGAFRPDWVGAKLIKVGFQQSWGVYAPEPIRQAETLEAIIAYADGTSTTWRIPRAGAAFPYPSHRWERWQDEITDGYAQWWDRAARWIAREHAAPGRVATMVTLRRRWALVPPPGAPATPPAWNSEDFLRLPLP